MVPITALIWPILLAAVLVFLASSLFHMVLPWHRKDFSGVAHEDDVLAALRKAGVGPGEYFLPHAADSKAMQDPAYQEKVKQGPVAILSVFSDFAMGKSLLLWFVYCVVVGEMVAYVAGRSLGPGTEYLKVFQITGCVAFMGYSLALIQNSIWYKRPWTTTLKHLIDGLVYGLLTGGVFGWLWPA